MNIVSRKDAKKQGLTRYCGKVCEKHPELKGERVTSNGKCIACARTLTRARHTERMKNDPVFKKRVNDRDATQKAKRRKDPEFHVKQCILSLPKE